MASGEGKAAKKPMAAGDRRRGGHSGRVVRTVEAFDGDRRKKLGATSDMLSMADIFADRRKNKGKGKTKVSKGAGGDTGQMGKSRKAG